MVAGLIAVAVAAGVGAAAIALPWPTVEVPPASAVVAPTPSEQQRVCPGPLLALAEDSSAAQAVTSVGRAASLFAAWSQSTGSVDVTRSNIDAVDNLGTDSTVAPEQLTVPVPAPESASAAPVVAGSQSQTLATETLTGLAVAGCGEASSDAWLVGGSTDVGRTSLVLLSNPTPVLATVSLTVYGETGVVDSPGASGILVQPGEQRVISLAGLAPNLISPIVNVKSTGGQVLSTLQQSSIRGIEPGGVDLISATGGPALEQTIAGLNVTVTGLNVSIAPSAERSGDFDAVASVRLMAVGSAPANVKIDVVGASGSAVGSSTDIKLESGIATEVPFPDLAVGSYSVQITSDEPVVAAARTSSVGAAGRDFAWYPSSGELLGDFVVSVAAGPSPTLHLVNAAPTDVDITLTPTTGETLRVSIAAGARAELPLAESVSYVVTGGKETVASVGYVGDGQLASFTLNPAGPLAETIRVYLR
jgi:hypothetical protein